jgi:hypothetical protein
MALGDLPFNFTFGGSGTARERHQRREEVRDRFKLDDDRQASLPGYRDTWP